jgi:hypothetical protein
MDPQQIEQQIQELCLVHALAQHDEPEGLFGMAQLRLGERLNMHYALQQDDWGLAA